MTCRQCVGVERTFDERVARRDLRRYRRSGPGRPTALLLEELTRAGVEGFTVLDVGGGVGAIQHELLGAGAACAVSVDASAAYLEASRDEARRRGLEGRVRYLHGDFVRLAASLEAADVVTLDRVLCCDPDVDGMTDAAAGRTLRLLGLVYPRERLPNRAGIPLVNLLYRLRGVPFAVFLHSPDRIDRRLRANGLAPRARRRTVLWEVALYERS